MGPSGKGLSPDQMAFFQAEGYLIVKGLFEPGELDDIRSTFERIGETTVQGILSPCSTRTTRILSKGIRASCIRIDSIQRP